MNKITSLSCVNSVGGSECIAGWAFKYVGLFEWFPADGGTFGEFADFIDGQLVQRANGVIHGSGFRVNGGYPNRLTMEVSTTITERDTHERRTLAADSDHRCNAHKNEACSGGEFDADVCSDVPSIGGRKNADRERGSKREPAFSCSIAHVNPCSIAARSCAALNAYSAGNSVQTLRLSSQRRLIASMLRCSSMAVALEIKPGDGIVDSREQVMATASFSAICHPTCYRIGTCDNRRRQVFPAPSGIQLVFFTANVMAAHQTGAQGVGLGGFDSDGCYSFCSCRVTFGGVRRLFFTKNRPIDVWPKFLATNSCQGFNVRAKFCWHSRVTPLVGYGMAFQTQSAGKGCNAS